MTASFQTVPEFLPDEKEHRRQLARAIRTLIQGKMNVTLDVTLRANQTTTIIKDSRISGFSAITPAMAQTANAAAAIAAGIWVSDRIPAISAIPGSATIHHASSANTDQLITFVILG